MLFFTRTGKESTGLKRRAQVAPSYHVAMIAFDPFQKHIITFELLYAGIYAFSLGALNNETIINQ